MLPRDRALFWNLLGMRAVLAARASSSAACARHAKRRAPALPVSRTRAASSGGGGGPGTSGAHARGAAEGGFWGDNASLGAGFLAVAIGAVGLSYASVPLYRVFCQATGYGGTCLLYTSPSPRDGLLSRMPSSA